MARGHRRGAANGRSPRSAEPNTTSAARSRAARGAARLDRFRDAHATGWLGNRGGSLEPMASPNAAPADPRAHRQLARRTDARVMASGAAHRLARARCHLSRATEPSRSLPGPAVDRQCRRHGAAIAPRPAQTCSMRVGDPRPRRRGRAAGCRPAHPAPAAARSLIGSSAWRADLFRGANRDAASRIAIASSRSTDGRRRRWSGCARRSHSLSSATLRIAA